MPAAPPATCSGCGQTVPVQNDCTQCPNCGTLRVPRKGLYLSKEDLIRPDSVAPLTPRPSAAVERTEPDQSRAARLKGLCAGAALGASGVVLAALFAGSTGLEIANGFIGALIGTVAGMVLGYIGAKFQTLFPMWMREYGLFFMLYSDRDYVKFMTVLGVLNGIIGGFLIGMQLELSVWIALPLGALGAALLFGLIGAMVTYFLAELKQADEEYLRRRYPQP
jgi:MFS family permease